MPGPVPLDVDTWEDYEAVLAARDRRDAPARAGASAELSRRVRDAGRSPRCSTASTTWPTRGSRRRCSSRCGCPSRCCSRARPGVGKTEAARALADALGTPLIRLQCYEGMDSSEALYEWNYPRQLLRIRLAEAGGEDVGEDDLFGREYLVRRPVLEAIEHPGPLPAVLLVDELDRADPDFEAFLLEVLADAAVTVPELGTIRARVPPAVVLTSNRTRDLHDALKRRCLYHWIDYPPPAARGRDRAPARARAPPRLAQDVVARARAGCAPPTCRSRRGSRRGSTGSRRWSCSAPSGWTRRRPTARSAPCSSTARTRRRCAPPGSSALVGGGA